MSNGDVWVCEIFEGMHFYTDEENYFFPSMLNSRVPSQAFEMIEVADSMLVVGNISQYINTLTVDIISDVDELAELNIRIYPNPVSDVLNIEGMEIGKHHVRLYDIRGTLVKSINESQISMHNLSPGQYLLEIKDKATGLRKVERVVVE